VLEGQASFQAARNNCTVNTTGQFTAISSGSIYQLEHQTLRINQPNSHAETFLISNTNATFEGSTLSNGGIGVVASGSITIGPNAQINVENFSAIAGVALITPNGLSVTPTQSGLVRNQGHITATQAITFVGHEIINSGSLTAQTVNIFATSRGQVDIERTSVTGLPQQAVVVAATPTDQLSAGLELYGDPSSLAMTPGTIDASNVNVASSGTALVSGNIDADGGGSADGAVNINGANIGVGITEANGELVTVPTTVISSGNISIGAGKTGMPEATNSIITSLAHLQAGKNVTVDAQSDNEMGGNIKAETINLNSVKVVDVTGSLSAQQIEYDPNFLGGLIGDFQKVGSAVGGAIYSVGNAIHNAVASIVGPKPTTFTANAPPPQVQAIQKANPILNSLGNSGTPNVANYRATDSTITSTGGSVSGNSKSASNQTTNSTVKTTNRTVSSVTTNLANGSAGGSASASATSIVTKATGSNSNSTATPTFTITSSSWRGAPSVYPTYVAPSIPHVTEPSTSAGAFTYNSTKSVAAAFTSKTISAKTAGSTDTVGANLTNSAASIVGGSQTLAKASTLFGNLGAGFNIGGSAGEDVGASTIAKLLPLETGTASEYQGLEYLTKGGAAIDTGGTVLGLAGTGLGYGEAAYQGFVEHNTTAAAETASATTGSLAAGTAAGVICAAAAAQLGVDVPNDAICAAAATIASLGGSYVGQNLAVAAMTGGNGGSDIITPTMRGEETENDTMIFHPALDPKFGNDVFSSLNISLSHSQSNLVNDPPDHSIASGTIPTMPSNPITSNPLSRGKSGIYSPIHGRQEPLINDQLPQPENGSAGTIHPSITTAPSNTGPLDENQISHGALESTASSALHRFARPLNIKPRTIDPDAVRSFVSTAGRTPLVSNIGISQVSGPALVKAAAPTNLYLPWLHPPARPTSLPPGL
jgi:hypothetical protein